MPSDAESSRQLAILQGIIGAYCHEHTNISNDGDVSAAARRIQAAGFELGRTEVDAQRDRNFTKLESRVTALEGWSGLRPG